jgi:hypothetical protein
MTAAGEEEAEQEQEDPALRALERQLVEKAVRDSRAVFSVSSSLFSLSSPERPPTGGGEGEGPETHTGKRPATAATSTPSSSSSSSSAAVETGRGGGKGEERERAQSLVNRVARLDAPCKALFDFLAPRDLAAAQQVGGWVSVWVWW